MLITSSARTICVVAAKLPKCLRSLSIFLVPPRLSGLKHAQIRRSISDRYFRRNPALAIDPLHLEPDILTAHHFGESCLRLIATRLIQLGCFDTVQAHFRAICQLKSKHSFHRFLQEVAFADTTLRSVSRGPIPQGTYRQKICSSLAPYGKLPSCVESQAVERLLSMRRKRRLAMV